MLGAIVALLVGFVVLIGGGMGFAKKGSVPSLFAGVGFGAVYLFCGFYILTRGSASAKVPTKQQQSANRVGNWIAAASSATLGVVFLVRLIGGASVPMCLGIITIAAISLFVFTRQARRGLA